MHILKTFTKLPFQEGCVKEVPVFLPDNIFIIFAKLTSKIFFVLLLLQHLHFLLLVRLNIFYIFHLHIYMYLKMGIERWIVIPFIHFYPWIYIFFLFIGALYIFKTIDAFIIIYSAGFFHCFYLSFWFIYGVWYYIQLSFVLFCF